MRQMKLYTLVLVHPFHGDDVIHGPLRRRPVASRLHQTPRVLIDPGGTGPRLVVPLADVIGRVGAPDIRRVLLPDPRTKVAKVAGVGAVRKLITAEISERSSVATVAA